MKAVKVDLPQPGAELELEIDGYDDEGRGRAHVDDYRGDFDVAVRGALPGDQVRARVERVWPAHMLLQARSVELLDRGPLHVPRDCPHRVPCPGCPLELADPGFSLEVKRGRIQQALDDVEISAEIDEIRVPVPLHGRRQKVKLIAGGGLGRMVFGLYVPHSHTLIGSWMCPFVDERIGQGLDALLEVLNEANVPAGETGVRAIIARAFEEGVALVVMTRAPLDPSVHDVMTALVPEMFASISERVNATEGNSLLGGDVVWSVGETTHRPLDGGPPVDVDAFCQPDPILAREMYRRASRFLTEGVLYERRETDDEEEVRIDVDVVDGARFVDAYAGTGGFTRALLHAGAAHVVAVERSPDVHALDGDARVTVVEKSAADFFDDESHQKSAITGVVADPSRKGLHDDAVRFAKLGAARFVLVSCDPDAMARDLRVLLDEGYEIRRMLPVDLFPGTPQIEVMTFLSRA